MAAGKVTVVEIAHAAGVSKSTVSLVLQGSPLVSEATRAKVNTAIRDLGFGGKTVSFPVPATRSGPVSVSRTTLLLQLHSIPRIQNSPAIRGRPAVPS